MNGHYTSSECTVHCIRVNPQTSELFQEGCNLETLCHPGKLSPLGSKPNLMQGDGMSAVVQLGSSDPRFLENGSRIRTL